ncbi:unnamed protein product [Gadus morhua 'NCC']
MQVLGLCCPKKRVGVSRLPAYLPTPVASEPAPQTRGAPVIVAVKTVPPKRLPTKGMQRDNRQLASHQRLPTKEMQRDHWQLASHLWDPKGQGTGQLEIPRTEVKNLLTLDPGRRPQLAVRQWQGSGSKMQPFRSPSSLSFLAKDDKGGPQDGPGTMI